jgi:hypothetical protein
MLNPINLINAIPLHYRVLILLTLFAAGFALGWLKGSHSEQLKAAKFEAATEALGKAALTRSQEIAARNLKIKQEADREYVKTKSELDRLYADHLRLRQRSGGSIVSTLPASTGSPQRVCFDSAKFADAVGVIEDGIPDILKQGDSAIIGLDAAKGWAQND